MRILYIASVRIPNEKASGLAITRQCEAFAALGHTVTLLRPRRKNHITEAPFSYYGIEPIFKVETMNSFDFVGRVWRFGFHLTRLSQMVTSFIFVLRNREKIDLLYARDPWMLILPLHFFTSLRTVWEAHQAQRGILVRFVARHATKVVCISDGLRRHFETLSGRKDIQVEPSGVHFEQFEQLPATDDIRKSLNLPLGKKIIGYVGKYTTMGEGKGVDDLIEAFAMLHRAMPETHLLIVGLEEAEQAIVAASCAESGLGRESFSLLPLEQKRFAEYVEATDVLVMNYPDTEHFRNYMSPTKLFAYMACRRTVVASDLPTVREIADDTMVVFVRPGDPKSLEEGLVRALSGSEEFDSMREHAYVRVKEFSWKNRAGRILKT